MFFQFYFSIILHYLVSSLQLHFLYHFVECKAELVDIAKNIFCINSQDCNHLGSIQ